MACFTPVGLCLSLLLLSPLIKAFELTGNIHWNDVCPAFSNIHDARVVLDNGRWSGNLRKDGRFTIPNVPQGTFILSVLSHDFQFDQLRIDVPDVDQRPSVHPYTPGTPLSPPSPVTLPYPISLSARSKNIYFAEREGFNVIEMLKSPMMLLMIFTGGMMFAMPYLMATMDPETRNEVVERQQRMFSAQNSLQNLDMGGLKNLLGGEPDSAPITSKPSLPTAVVSGKGKGKGRKR